MPSKVTQFMKERETKNKIRYNDNGEFGPLYVPKSYFGDKVPDEVEQEIRWK